LRKLLKLIFILKYLLKLTIAKIP